LASFTRIKIVSREKVGHTVTIYTFFVVKVRK
jgi:hypothetical protein